MADIEVNEKYRSIRQRHGQNHASANGYVGQWFFLREQRFLLPQIGPGTTLDIACGSGLMLAPRGSFVGLDYNFDACQQAALNQLMVIRGDAFQLPFEDASFDNAVNCQFLNQQNEQQTVLFLKEASRVLKPQGELHLMWRGAETLVHRSVNWLSQRINDLRHQENFPQYLHTVDSLVHLGKQYGFGVKNEAMTLPIGAATVRPNSILAHVLGASHYLCLKKVSS